METEIPTLVIRYALLLVNNKGHVYQYQKRYQTKDNIIRKGYMPYYSGDRSSNNVIGATYMVQAAGKAEKARIVLQEKSFSGGLDC
jgi:hypothetical protein